MDFTLEKWDLKYAEDFQKAADNPNIAANLRDGFPSPCTLQDAVNMVSMFADDKEELQCIRAIVIEEHAVGCIGFFIQSNVYSKTAEVAYWISEEYWGRGIISEALKKMCEYGFNNYDIIRFYAEPYAYNAGSRKVLEKAGFSHEGTMIKGVFKNGKYLDYCMYALIKSGV